jgi:hypothetical protein
MTPPAQQRRSMLLSCPAWLGLVLGGAWLASASCTALNSYESVPTATAGHGGTSAGGAGGAGHGSGGGGHGTGAGGSGTTTTSGSGGSGGGGAPCAHDVCSLGAALDASCSPCASAVCAAYPGCCSPSDPAAWTGDCIVATRSLCAQSNCPLSCDYLFGHVAGYVECLDLENQCRFSLDTSALIGSCDDVCAAHGVECASAAENSPNCTGGAPLACSALPTGSSFICTCVYSCANGPVCPPGRTCGVNGCADG